MKKLFALVLALAFTTNIYSDEGIWIPSKLKGVREKEMKKLGLQIPVDKIYNENMPSINDAIAHFGGGCTGEVISQLGLILTNHHCGFSYIQSHSSVENDYLKKGFWAKNSFEEKECDGLEVKIVQKIEDVTSKVYRGINNKTSEEKRKEIISKNIKNLKKKTKIKDYQELIIKPFYKGNMYYMFISNVYKDVRLVGAPPSSIGKYGSDTDNWMWPRHSGDFALFRIYVDKNNNPAEYSKTNVPYRAKYHLPVSTKGIKENDFTMIFGYPGRTNEYLPSQAVKQIIEVTNPIRISMRDATLKVLDSKMRVNDTTRIKYASKYARISNAWKKWIGQIEGINRTKGIERKEKFEEKFIQKNKVLKRKKENNSLIELNKNYKNLEPYEIDRSYYLELVSRVEAIDFTHDIKCIIEKEEDYKEELLDLFKKFFKDYEKELDNEVFTSVLKVYLEGKREYKRPINPKFSTVNTDYKKYVNDVFKSTILLDKEKISELVNKLSKKQLLKELKTDKLYSLYTSLRDDYKKNVIEKSKPLYNKISKLQRDYMGKIYMMYSDDKIYPDANSTLRISYGKVKGFSPRDGVTYKYQTTLKGAMEKYKKGDYEFDMDKKLLAAGRNKFYGNYGENGKLYVNFIATNHTTGGNSGSPALDKDGNLIGLNFDRVWEGTMSDFNFDEKVCRNVMVDVRYILFVIDIIGGQKRLIQEMTIVK